MSTANSPQIKRVPGSYADYQRLASTSSITEWVEGELRFMPSPSIVHQLILKLFFNLLEAVVNHQRLGLVLFAPFEVKLWSDGPARQPDIFFLTNEQRQSLSEQRFNGPPALVVEIVSPGSVREDQVEKFKEYEKAGVREYWLIDSRPENRSVDLFLRNKDGLLIDAEPDENRRLSSTAVPGFWIDPHWVQSDPLVDEKAAISDIMLSLPNLSPEVRAYYQFLSNQ